MLSNVEVCGGDSQSMVSSAAPFDAAQDAQFLLNQNCNKCVTLFAVALGLDKGQYCGILPLSR